MDRLQNEVPGSVNGFTFFLGISSPKKKDNIVFLSV